MTNTPYPKDFICRIEDYLKILEDIEHVPYSKKPPIRLAMTKVMKEEFEKLELFEIDEDLFTYDTQIGMIFNKFNRLSRINDDLFTWEIEVPKPTPSVEQQTSDPKHNDPREYEWKINYDECEKIYAEEVIFINKRLIRLNDVTVEQWLDLKYGDHKTMDKNVKKGVIEPKTYEDYESDLNNEDDEPRSEDGVPYEVSAYAVSRFLDMTYWYPVQFVLVFLLTVGYLRYDCIVFLYFAQDLAGKKSTNVVGLSFNLESCVL
ncbi:hypothetical protein Tco_1387030 [Tanacetum coccineum]